MFTLFLGIVGAFNFAWTAWVNHFDIRDLAGIVPMFFVGGTLGGLGMAIGFSVTWSIFISIRRALKDSKLPKGVVQTPSEIRVVQATEVFRVLKSVRRSTPTWKEVKIAWKRA